MRPMGPGGPPKKLDKAIVSRVAAHFKPYKPQVVLIVVLVMISATVGLANPFLLKNLVNNGLLARNLDVVMRDSLLTLVATLVATAAGIGYAYVSVVVGQSIMRDLRNGLFTHLQAMPLKWFTISSRTSLKSS